MKNLKLLLVSMIGFVSIANAGTIQCSYDIRGLDMTERTFAIFIEDSFKSETFDSTPEHCVCEAINQLNLHRRIKSRISRGKSFTYQPGNLHVTISIVDNKGVVQVDQLNSIIANNINVNAIRSFEHGSTPYTADIAVVLNN